MLDSLSFRVSLGQNERVTDKNRARELSRNHVHMGGSQWGVDG